MIVVPHLPDAFTEGDRVSLALTGTNEQGMWVVEIDGLLEEGFTFNHDPYRRFGSTVEEMVEGIRIPPVVDAVEFTIKLRVRRTDDEQRHIGQIRWQPKDS